MEREFRGLRKEVGKKKKRVSRFEEGRRQERGLQGLRKEQRWARKGVARDEEGSEVGKNRGCKG